jgi:hypothetical protein
MTSPALKATMAKAMVIETKAWSVLGLSGPYCSTAKCAGGYDETGDEPADDMGPVGDASTLLAVRSLHHAGVAHVDNDPNDDDDDDEELAEQQHHGEQGHTAVDV